MLELRAKKRAALINLSGQVQTQRTGPIREVKLYDAPAQPIDINAVKLSQLAAEKSAHPRRWVGYVIGASGIAAGTWVAVKQKSWVKFPTRMVN